MGTYEFDVPVLKGLAFDFFHQPPPPLTTPRHATGKDELMQATTTHMRCVACLHSPKRCQSQRMSPLLCLPDLYLSLTSRCHGHRPQGNSHDDTAEPARCGRVSCSLPGPQEAAQAQDRGGGAL